ncbi:MAG: VOC family protein [Pseudomonadota bacterium]
MDRGFQVRALGEVAIRCADLDAMTAFYRDVIGLSVLSDRGRITFFDLGEGYGGHTTVLALFAYDAPQRDVHPQVPQKPLTGAGSALHHLALTVGADEQQAVIDWYRHLGQPYRIEEFPWIGWRGVFTQDPEGNTVELVAKVAEPIDQTDPQDG